MTKPYLLYFLIASIQIYVSFYMLPNYNKTYYHNHFLMSSYMLYMLAVYFQTTTTCNKGHDGSAYY